MLGQRDACFVSWDSNISVLELFKMQKALLIIQADDSFIKMLPPHVYARVYVCKFVLSSTEWYACQLMPGFASLLLSIRDGNLVSGQ